MISPGLSSCEHTLNTLRYADRVKELSAGVPGASDHRERYSPDNGDDNDDSDTDLQLVQSRNVSYEWNICDDEVNELSADGRSHRGHTHVSVDVQSHH